MHDRQNGAPDKRVSHWITNNVNQKKKKKKLNDKK